jgi:hypothetical protein
MTHSRALFAALTIGLSAVICGPAAAQFGSAQPAPPITQTAGSLEPKLRAGLDAARAGTCPPALMAPLLAYQCSQQIVPMQQRLAQLGPFKRAEFAGIQSTPMGPAEAWIVSFANGQMLWMLNLDDQGRLNVFWSPG